MKYRYLLSLLIVTVIFSKATYGQLVGGSVYIQGAFLEIGECDKGAFGTCPGTVPAGYHPHMGGAIWNPGDALGEVYDWGHDGWSVGTPPLMGDYTEPGYPFEGWSVQVGATEYRNWVDAGLCGGSFFIPGSLTGYSNSGGKITGTFTGDIVGLHIVAETRVDTLASAVVVTVRFYNTTGAPINDVYYERTCDPDNVSTWTGGSLSTTHNVIVHQNEDARHDVLVSSCADMPASPPTYNLATYMGIGTKDCRAVCTYFGHNTLTYGLTPGYTPDSMWHKAISSSTYSYAVGDSNFADIGYALIYKLGTINAAGTPGDSAVISFAYIYNTNSGLDSAFPEPLLVVNGVDISPSGPAPAPTFDTFNTCDHIGLVSLPVSIKNATDKCWTWSSWTWSPSTGLASTTGVNQVINVGALSAITTYTIIGTDSAVNMFSCNHRVMYITVIPCLSASSNSPGPEGTPWAPDPGSLGTIDAPGPGWGQGTGGICLYDTLRLAARGDSTGATYFWYGPGGFTSIQQYTQRLPALSMADTGWYYVVKTVGSEHDTAKTFVMFNPLPIVTATTNAPICSGTTLNLFANPDSTTETFAWSGPQGFTSTDQNPTIAGVPVKDSGIYKVITTLYNCVDSGFVHVVIDSAPVVPNVWSNSPGAPIGPSICQGDTLRLFAADSTPGVTYGWTGPVSFLSVDQNPVIYNVLPSASGVYTVTATLDICLASAVTTVSITPTPILIATNNGPVCTGVEDTLLLQAVSVPGATYTWTGPYVFYSLNQNPYRTPVSSEYEGIYQVTAMAGGCKSATVNDTVVIRKTPKTPIVPWLTYCQYFNAPVLQAMGDSILWYPSGAAHGIGTLDAPTPSTDAIGVTWFYVSQTLMSCTSAIDSIRVSIIPRPTLTLTENTEICPHDTAVITASSNEAIAYYHWFPPTYLSDTSAATVIVRPENNVHYTVVLTNKFGCTDTGHANVNVYAGAVISLGDSVSLYPGESYHISPQTNCVTFAWFPPAGLDNAGIADPTATPQISTKYIVRAETSWGCKVKDSINIYIDPEASLAMPNAFTPGATGTNSEFKIIKRGLASLKYFRIWDRWGVKVFETTDIDQGWNGTLNGKPQPFGVYIYEVSAETNTGRAFIKHGNVTLVR